MSFGFFLREAMRSMRRNGAPSLAALIAVLVTVVVLGVVIPFVQATDHAANVVRSRLIVDVYMKNTATPADDARVRAELLRVPHVKLVQFESKQQAYQQEVQADPSGGWQLLGNNPLPDTFHVYPDNPSNVLKVRAALSPASGAIDPAIKNISNRKQETSKALELTTIVPLAALAVALLLALASVVLIANTIRLSLYARRREIEVMKLVGATDWFIRWPFMIEGLLVGAAGGALAILLLGVAKLALVDPLLSGWALVADIKTMAFPALVVVLLGASAALSAVGSGLSLRGFLRV